jgi:Ca-activated chloride channel homolog
MNDPEPTRIAATGSLTGGINSDYTLGRTSMTIGASPADILQPVLTLHADPGNHYVRANVDGRIPVLFTAKSSKGTVGVRSPLNICICLDRSGSMEGEPLEYAKRACDHVVDILEPNDTLAIVTFSDQADIVMPARRVVNKAVIKDYVHRIMVGNTTNVYDGLSAASQQVLSAKTDVTLNRILLLTDGEPTAGTKDFSTIIRLVSDSKHRGITVTALGFGPDYNEELVAAIARRSGGNYYYISRPELLPEMFRRELEGMMKTVARNVVLQVSVPRDIDVHRVYGKEFRKSGERSFEVLLPDAESGCDLSSIWEFNVAEHRGGTYRFLRAELAYDECLSGRRTGGLIDVEIEFSNDAALIAANVNPQVMSELEVAKATRNLDRTLMSSKTQALDTKTILSDMYRTQTLLMQHGKIAAADQVHEAMRNIRKGDSLEKTLTGTIYQLELGKQSSK